MECRNISKTYGKKKAVDDVSFTLKKGRVYAMLGPNGSGKTTLMKMAAGLVKPSSGGFYYKGKPIDIESKKEIAYMSTEPYFYPWMTIKDAGEYYKDFFDDFSMTHYEELIGRMELEKTMKVKALSSGMMAKLKIAVTLSRKAKVFFLDEPLNGIDLLARDEIMKSILETMDPDVTLVISSHLVDELEQVADEAVFIKDGKLAGVWEVEKLRFEEGKSIVDLYREIYGQGGEAVC